MLKPATVGVSQATPEMVPVESRPLVAPPPASREDPVSPHIKAPIGPAMPASTVRETSGLALQLESLKQGFRNPYLTEKLELVERFLDAGGPVPANDRLALNRHNTFGAWEALEACYRAIGDGRLTSNPEVQAFVKDGLVRSYIMNVKELVARAREQLKSGGPDSGELGNWIASFVTDRYKAETEGIRAEFTALLKHDPRRAARYEVLQREARHSVYLLWESEHPTVANLSVEERAQLVGGQDHTALQERRFAAIDVALAAGDGELALRILAPMGDSIKTYTIVKELHEAGLGGELSLAEMIARAGERLGMSIADAEALHVRLEDLGARASQVRIVQWLERAECNLPNHVWSSDQLAVWVQQDPHATPEQKAQALDIRGRAFAADRWNDAMKLDAMVAKVSKALGDLSQVEDLDRDRQRTLRHRDRVPEFALSEAIRADLAAASAAISATDARFVTGLKLTTDDAMASYEEALASPRPASPDSPPQPIAWMREFAMPLAYVATKMLPELAERVGALEARRLELSVSQLLETPSAPAARRAIENLLATEKDEGSFGYPGAMAAQALPPGRADALMAQLRGALASSQPS